VRERITRKLIIPIIWKGVKYYLSGSLCFALATIFFFLLISNVGVNLAWFISNFLAGGLLGFFIQLFYVYNDAEANKLKGKSDA
jgi:hypothetical protein